MTWDEMLGLMVGVAIVVLVALVYYKPEGGSWRLKDAAARTPVQGAFRTVQLSPMPAVRPDQD